MLLLAGESLKTLWAQVSTPPPPPALLLSAILQPYVSMMLVVLPADDGIECMLHRMAISTHSTTW